MEAGDAIRFIPQYEFQDVGEAEKIAVRDFYSTIVSSLWDRFPEGVRRYESNRYSRTQELPLRLDFRDGSYVYFLVEAAYTHGLREYWNGGNINTIIANEKLKTDLDVNLELDVEFAKACSSPSIIVEEHSSTGTLLQTLAYGYDRTRNAVTRHEVRDLGHITTHHTSYIELEQKVDNLVLIKPDETIEFIHNTERNALLEAEMRVNDMPVEMAEVLSLAEILKSNDLRVYSDLPSIS